MIVAQSQVHDRSGTHIGQSRVKFLGVLWGGPMLDAEGDIIVAPAPTTVDIRSRTQIPINLGFVIKSRVLLEFDDMFAQEMRRAADD